MKPVAWLLAVPLAILGIGAYVWFAMPKDVSFHARDAALAYERGDVDRLFEHVYEHERGGFTKDQFRQLYSDLVRPRIASFQPSGEAKIYRINPFQADSSQTWTDPRGRRFEVELRSDLTPDGGRINLFDVLRPAYYAAFVERTGKPVTEATFAIAIAIAEGLERDIPRLERIGILRFHGPDPDSKGIALARQLDWYRRRALTIGTELLSNDRQISRVPGLVVTSLTLKP